MSRGRSARCARCGVPCLAYALRTRPAAGVWAGLHPGGDHRPDRCRGPPGPGAADRCPAPGRGRAPAECAGGVVTAVDSRRWACGGCGAVLHRRDAAGAAVPGVRGAAPGGPARACRGAAVPGGPGVRVVRRGRGPVGAGGRHPGRGDLPDVVRPVRGCRADAAAELPGRGAPRDGARAAQPGRGWRGERRDGVPAAFRPAVQARPALRRVDGAERQAPPGRARGRARRAAAGRGPGGGDRLAAGPAVAGRPGAGAADQAAGRARPQCPLCGVTPAAAAAQRATGRCRAAGPPTRRSSPPG